MNRQIALSQSEMDKMEKDFYGNKEVQAAIKRLKEQYKDSCWVIPFILFMAADNPDVPKDGSGEDMKVLLDYVAGFSKKSVEADKGAESHE